MPEGLQKRARLLAAARSKAEVLHAPEDLLAIIRSGNHPEMRLRLKAEIAKRVAHRVFVRRGGMALLLSTPFY
jgi:hypothetical protein